MKPPLIAYMPNYSRAVGIKIGNYNGSCNELGKGATHGYLTSHLILSLVQISKYRMSHILIIGRMNHDYVAPITIYCIIGKFRDLIIPSMIMVTLVKRSFGEAVISPYSLN